jgi:opacity protein-like surface antigen
MNRADIRPTGFSSTQKGEIPMKRRTLVLGAVVFCLSASAAVAADVFSGNWKVNFAKSKYVPGPTPKGPNFSRIDAMDGGLKFTNDGVNAEGKPTHSEWSGKFDGKDNPVKGDPARDTAALKKIDDYTFEITNKKGGKVVGTIRAVFSRDGKTRTQTGQGTNAQGVKTNNIVVYEK